MAGQLTIDTLKASSGVLATQNGMTGIAKAWVNFNGNSGASNTIRSAFNVSSITKNATGDYTLNFTTAMADANYALLGTGGVSNTAMRVPSTNYAVQAPTTTATRFQTAVANGTIADTDYLNIAVFGN